MSDGMTKSQRKRAAFNYRDGYFKKNPGLFGCIWFCSQCGIPLLGKSAVQVDHILPLAGIGINRTINTVAACPRCNNLKSDKAGIYSVKGGIAKIFEVIMFTAQKVFILAFVAALRIIHFMLTGVIKLLCFPVAFSNGRAKVFVMIIYVVAVYYCLKTFKVL